MIDQLLPLAQRISRQTKSFYLAGGTAITLKYNHRTSYDLDFFCEKAFSFKSMERKMKDSNEGISKVAYGEDNLDIFIDNTKASFVFFPYQNIRYVEDFQGIRIASDIDLLLNKLYVASRRIDAKDPFDFAWLWQKCQWPVARIRQQFEQKFEGHSFEIAVGAIASFEDYPELEEWAKATIQEFVEQIS